MCVPQTRSATPASRLSRIFTRLLCSSLDGGQRRFDDIERLIELLGGDDQWRREREHVALADLERQSAGEALVHHLLGLASGRPPIAPELDPEQETQPAGPGH